MLIGEIKKKNIICLTIYAFLNCIWLIGNKRSKNSKMSYPSHNIFPLCLSEIEMSESWFSKHRGLSEVHSEMARRGFHYDRTAVAHALIDLVKDGILTREGKPRRYQYAQKRPPLI